MNSLNNNSNTCSKTRRHSPPSAHTATRGCTGQPMMLLLLLVALSLLLIPCTNSFAVSRRTAASLSSLLRAGARDVDENGDIANFDSKSDSRPRPAPTLIEIDLGPGFKPLQMGLLPVFEQSEFIKLDFDVPFGLNIEKPPRNFPCPIVTKDGKNGEKRGDILRATTCWSQGFQAAGAASDILAFAGQVKWRKSVFDCTGAQWQQVVDALKSNIPERSTTVTLVFERNLAED